MTASEKPVRFASRRRCGVSGSERRRCSIWTMPFSLWVNQGSTAEIFESSSGVWPRRSAARSAHSRSSVGSATRAAGATSRQGGASQRRERPPHSRGAEGLAQRRLEGAVDRHHLAGGLHLGAEGAVAQGELVERPAGDLDHAVVEGGLEGRRRAAGGAVGDLVQALAGGDLGGEAGDRVAGGLGGGR